jgi:ketosteroid isomerase-like protein
MSAENVETLREAMAALNSDGVDGFLRYLDPEIEWITPPEWLEERVLHGHDGVRTALAYMPEQLDEWNIVLERVVDLGGDRIVGLMMQRGRIKGSGGELELAFGAIVDFRGGKAARSENYFSWEQTLEAAGCGE